MKENINAEPIDKTCKYRPKYNGCKECMKGAPFDFCCRYECREHEFCRGCTFIKTSSNNEKEKKETKEEKLKNYYASGLTLVEGRWQSCGWNIQAHSFTEAAQIAENDEKFRLHSLSDCVVY